MPKYSNQLMSAHHPVIVNITLIAQVFVPQHAVSGGVSSSHNSFNKCNNGDKYGGEIWDYFAFKLVATNMLNSLVVCSNRDDF